MLEYLRSPVFEPLSLSSLRNLTRKTLSLVALATAKRVGELQALSRIASLEIQSKKKKKACFFNKKLKQKILIQ